jgi:2-polyprenyl-3-methyl-5-hydroxy-6-metoxy-1,4-benzoquinol methylase
MTIHRGTEGYDKVVEDFITATKVISFDDLHAPYLSFIPKQPSRILDVGAGIGRDAHHLASIGHCVVAIEPLPEFLETAKGLFCSPNIQWVNDALPELNTLPDTDNEAFDFILISAVWHHLDEIEREAAIQRITGLVSKGGIIALSLRNGSAGVGTRVFPTDAEDTIKTAKQYGLEPIVVCVNQPSLVAKKKI